jgi:hypothetical protein
MSYVCPLCFINPYSHSLKKVYEDNNFIIFYTCPAEAILYYDTNSILQHYNGVLNEIPTNKQWIWIFDSSNFKFTHFIQFNVGIELAKLISNNFSNNLNKIIIINTTLYISFTYNIIYPFLNNKLKSIIEFNNIFTNYQEIINNIIIIS